MNTKHNILIVDDDANLCRTLSDIFRAKGYAPSTAATGKAALDKVRQEAPAVALIDLRLEDMPGLELMKKIREHSPGTECIVLTGYASRDSAIEAINLDAYGYVQKPCDVEQLLVTIRRAVEKRQAEQALRESEKRLRRVVENMPMLMDAFDTEGNIIAWNQECERVTGYSADEIIGNPRVAQLLYPDEDYRTYLMEQLTRYGGNFRNLEWDIGCKDGGKKTILWSNMSEQFPVPGWHSWAVGLDITGRKRAEEERARLLAQIQEQAQRVQQIVDTVPEGVLLLDTDGRVMLANPVAKRDLAVLAEAKVGDTLTHLGDRSLAELLTSPLTKGLWHEVTMDDRVFEVIARPMENGPEPEIWVLVISDVTREREIQRYSQQQERLATVGQLAAGISHDFNNIMATIVLYAHMLLRKEDLLPPDRERLVTINQQALHATSLIQQILDFSRRSVLERQPLDLSPLLKEQVKLLERTLPESIQIDLSYGLDKYTVNADPTRVQQVMMNLALNARDAMPEGGNLHFGLERIQVKPGESPPLPGMAEGEWVQVTVSDTGTGVPPDVLPHIFDPFFTTKALGEGSGLGLAQVHGIVKLHGGEVDVQSQVGQGTTFTIYLPALPVHAPEAVALELPALVKGQGETILVVEDNTATREALVDSLELLNYRVLEAANGREALAIFEQQTSEVSEDFRSLEKGRIALVLSDVVMPEMGGQALFHALRQRDPTVKVVLLTGHPLEKELENLQAQGLSGWLLKPPSLEQLAQMVARALNFCTLQD